jgi:hypothetical protein
MIVVKSYFLSEFERYETEKKIVELVEGISEEDLFALDDQELIQKYNECTEGSLLLVNKLLFFRDKNGPDCGAWHQLLAPVVWPSSGDDGEVGIFSNGDRDYIV